MAGTLVLLSHYKSENARAAVSREQYLASCMLEYSAPGPSAWQAQSLPIARLGQHWDSSANGHYLTPVDNTTANTGVTLLSIMWGTDPIRCFVCQECAEKPTQECWGPTALPGANEGNSNSHRETGAKVGV